MRNSLSKSLGVSGVVITAALLFAGADAFAQEQSLGDVARESRSAQSSRAHAKKVITDEDYGPKAIGPADDPIAVYKLAGELLIRDTAHRCVENASGNSGPAPGWAEQTTTEASSDGIHVIVGRSSPEVSRGEAILIGNDAYSRQGNGPWQRTAQGYGKLLMPNPGFKGLDRETLDYQFHGWTIKQIGREVVNGMPTQVYEFSVHLSDFDRTITSYVGIYDNRLYRTHMLTITRSWGSAPVTWQTTTTCTYGTTFSIKRPL